MLNIHLLTKKGTYFHKQIPSATVLFITKKLLFECYLLFEEEHH